MYLKENLNNKAYFFSNVFENDSFLDSVIEKSIKKELNGDFIAKFELIRDNKNDFSPYNNINFIKHYGELNDSEKFVFNNSEYLKSEYITVDRKDIDIKLDDTTAKSLNDKIIEVISSVYPNTDLEIEYGSIIKYGNGYKMNKHKDGGHCRVCTVVLYLNSKSENSSGGELVFYDDKDEQNQTFSYSPLKNDLVVFDSVLDGDTLPHSVIEIKDWERYVYRVYFNNKELTKNLIV